MQTRIAYRFYAGLVLIAVFFINSLKAQPTPRITTCTATEAGNPTKVTVTANVVDASTGAAINGASVTINCGSQPAKTTTTDASGNSSATFSFPKLTTVAGENCKVCVTPNAASKGSDLCCQCKVAGGATNPGTGSGPGEVAMILFVILALLWLGWKVYKKQLKIA